MFKRLERDLDFATWFEMSREFYHLGHAVELIFPKIKNFRLNNFDGITIKFLTVPRYRLAFSFIFGLRAFLYLALRMFSCSPQFIIIDDLGYIAFLPLIILSKLGWIRVKFILDIRTLPVEVNDSILRLKERISGFVYKTSKLLTAGITVISPAMKDYLVRTYDMSKANIGIWTSGIALSVFTKKNVDVSFEYPFNTDKYIILYHGIITKSRGLFESVQSFVHISTIKPDIVLLLLGSGPARGDLEELISRLCLKDNVVIHDPVPYERIPDYINAADVGLIPLPKMLGWRVSSPLKLLEYLALGKPVIVSDIEAHRDVIGEAKYGVYLDSITPETIANAINFAFTHRVELAMAGVEAQKMIIKKYTWGTQANNLSRYLYNLLEGE